MGADCVLVLRNQRRTHARPQGPCAAPRPVRGPKARARPWAAHRPRNVSAGWHGSAMTNRRALDQLVKRQSCVITRKQALECGLSRDTVYRRLRTAGQWQRILPGVYLTVTGTPTSEQRDVAAVLYA